MIIGNFLNKKITTNNKKITIVLLLISLCFALYFFGDKDKNTFLFVHDGQNFSSINDVYNKSFVLLNYNEGLYKFNTVAPFLYFINVAFYYPLFYLDIPINVINSLFYFFIQFLTFTFSFFGFLSIYKYLILKDDVYLKVQDLINISIVSFFYFFNTFNILNINNGIFFSLAYLSYALLPFYLFYLLKLLNNDISKKEIVLFSIISFSVILNLTYTISVLLLSLVVFLLKIKIKNIKHIALPVLFILCIFCLLSLPMSIPFILQSLDKNFIDNNLANSTNGLIQGGFLTVFKNQFSWVLYNGWEPRSIYSFHKYFNNLSSPSDLQKLTGL